jgi:hypothetical protein
MWRALGWLMVFCCWIGPGAASEEAQGWERVYVTDPFGRRVLEKALEGAASRLARQDCRRLFDFYRDSSGRPLAETLAAHRKTPAEYLRILVFTDGGTRKTCQGEQHAYTSIGSRVVYVCASRFTRGWQQNRAHAEASLIHELLHALGLGENPPSSSDITDRVLRACGRS